MKYYGGIEAGGTKIVCAIGNQQREIIEKVSIATETPEQTMPQIINFFKGFEDDLSALGIGCFGPIDPKPSSRNYGLITNTPKLPWRHFNIVQALKAQFDVPIGFDTDVNAAALAECYLGHGQEVHNLLYVTIGTGIGVGVCIDRKPLHGLSHPEMGHMLIPVHPDDTKFKSHCPYHDHCWEGRTAGPAVKARWGMSTHSIAEDHPAWDLAAYYIAVGLVNLILTHSPERIIVGGGLMQQSGLFAKIYREIPKLLNNYIEHEMILERLEQYIIYPKLGQLAGTYGALLLAEQALEGKS